MQPSCFVSGCGLVCIVSMADNRKKVCSLFLPLFLFVSTCAHQQIKKSMHSSTLISIHLNAFIHSHKHAHKQIKKSMHSFTLHKTYWLLSRNNCSGFWQLQMNKLENLSATTLVNLSNNLRRR